MGYLLPLSVSRKDQHPREARGENCTNACEKDLIEKEVLKKNKPVRVSDCRVFQPLFFLCRVGRREERRRELVHTFHRARVYTARATVYAESTVSSP